MSTRNINHDTSKEDLKLFMEYLDEDIVKTSCEIIEIESNEGEDKINLFMIDECVENIIEINGIKKLSNEEITQRISKIANNYKRNTNGKNTNNNIFNTKGFRRILVAICIILGIFTVNTIAYMNGFDSIKYLNVYFREIFHLPVGDNFNVDEIIFTKNENVISYESLDDMVSKEKVEFLFPSYLPEGVALKKVIYNTNKNNFDIIFEFTSDILKFKMNSYELQDLTQAVAVAEIHESNGITFYILRELSECTVYFESGNIQYILSYPEYESIIKIINNMEVKK